MKNFIVYLNLIALCLAPIVHASEKQVVWDNKDKDAAIQSCTSEFTDLQIRAAKMKARDTGENIADNIEERMTEMRTMSLSTCSCIIANASERWTFQEMNDINSNPKKYIEFLMELFCSKTCPVPTYLPLVDCKQLG